MYYNFLFIVFIVFFSLSETIRAQSIDIICNNQYESFIVLSPLKGDKLISVDTLKSSNGHVQYKGFHDLKTGVYRLNFGQTAIAKIMNEPPQQLDFIFNGEDINIETDFNAPLDSVKVIQSIENQVWFEFLKKEKQYQKQIKELVMQINYFQKNKDAYYTLAKQSNIISTYNSLQSDRNKLIESIIQKYPKLYASRLIQIKHEPLIDGNLMEQERKEILKKHYFDNVSFTDESLMNSSAYTDKVFKYFMLYAQKGLSKEKQEEEFKKAIDIILDKTKANPDVSAFIVDYLLRGFEKLGLDNLQSHISDRYSVPHGCSDANNTLKRRLAYQQMKEGDEVPDFSLLMNDKEKINLYQVHHDYKLVLFWETDCPMCRALLPQLMGWYFSKEIDLEIMAISIDLDKEHWRTWLANNNYPWINLNESHKWDGKVATAYNLYATPTMFLLDKENKILAKPIDFSGFLDAVLKL